MQFPTKYLRRIRPADGAAHEASALRWLRVSATGFALMFALLTVWAWTWNFKAANFTDYLSYWAAGKLALAGAPAAAYDVVKHRAMEFTVTRIPGLLPFPYPPPFLLVVTPFSLLPYHWGFAAWVLVTAAIYIAGTRRVADLPFTLGHPSVLMNGLIGQNGLLTCPIFVTGAFLLRKRPFLAEGHSPPVAQTPAFSKRSASRTVCCSASSSSSAASRESSRTSRRPSTVSRS